MIATIGATRQKIGSFTIRPMTRNCAARASGGPESRCPGCCFGTQKKMSKATPTVASASSPNPAATVPAQGLVRDLRRAGLVADLPYADRTLNGHMKAAAKAGARTVVILGEQELAAGQAAVRDMTARDQRPVPLDQVVDQVRRVAGGGAP